MKVKKLNQFIKDISQINPFCQISQIEVLLVLYSNPKPHFVNELAAITGQSKAVNSRNIEFWCRGLTPEIKEINSELIRHWPLLEKKPDPQHQKRIEVYLTKSGHEYLSQYLKLEK